MSQLLAFQQQWCLTHWGDPGVNVWGPPNPAQGWEQESSGLPVAGTACVPGARQACPMSWHLIHGACVPDEETKLQRGGWETGT